MLLIGLTGSISTGKSTSSQILSSPPFSLPIIDADRLASDAVTPTSALGRQGYNAIIRHFSPSTPDLLLPRDPATGIMHINRPVLGRRVFGAGPEKAKNRAAMNRIIHPIVRNMIIWEILKHWAKGHWAIVLDVPLLFESGLDLICGGVIVVGLRDQDLQIERLLARDRENRGTLTREDAEDRVKSQMSIPDKVEMVERCWGGEGRKKRGFVVWNDGTKNELKVQLAEVVEKFKEGRGRLYTGLGRWVPGWAALRAMVVFPRNWWRKWRYLRQKTQKLKTEI